MHDIVHSRRSVASIVVRVVRAVASIVEVVVRSIVRASVIPAPRPYREPLTTRGRSFSIVTEDSEKPVVIKKSLPR